MEDNDDMLQYLSEKQIKGRKVDLILKLYSTMGLMVAILGGAYFVLTLIPYELTYEQTLSLTFAGVGIFLALFSRMYAQLRKERDESDIARVQEFEKIESFLDAWSQFERTSKAVLSEENDSYNKHSLRSIISRLYEEEKINKEDVLVLEEALQTRNSIVHGKKPWSTDLTTRVTEVLIEIVKKITI